MYRGPALGRHSKLFSMREALREDAARVGDISEDSHPKHGLGSLNIFRLTLTHLINVSRTVRNGLPTLPRPAWRRHRFNLMSSDTDKMLQRTAVWSPWQAYRLGSIVVGFPLPSTNSCRDGCRAQGAYSDCRQTKQQEVVRQRKPVNESRCWTNNKARRAHRLSRRAVARASPLSFLFDFRNWADSHFRHGVRSDTLSGLADAQTQRSSANMGPTFSLCSHR